MLAEHHSNKVQEVYDWLKRHHMEETVRVKLGFRICWLLVDILSELQMIRRGL